MNATLLLSPRLAAELVVRLAGPRLTPVAKAARRHEKRLYRLFRAAVREAQDAVPMGELQQALGIPGTGGPLYVLQDVVDMFLEQTTRETLVEPYFRSAAEKATVAGVLADALEAGAHASTLAMAFDVTNPEAVAWAERNAARLVKNVTDDVKDAIRLFVQRGFEEGIPPDRLAVLIRDGIGLTPRDAGAVLNRRAELLADGLAQDVVERRTQAYSEKLIRRRALTIARTETMRASNEGQAQLWAQAREAGLLTGNERKVWITADPCPICAPLEGETVRIDEDFSIGADPPAHPNCRCSIGLVA